jgi:polar amino acid transport system substrate-binding protein
MKKKIVLGIAIALSIASVFAGCSKSENSAQDESLKYIQENQELILGLDDSFPPMGFKDENGEIVGFDIDMAKEVASRMGVELKLQPIDWDSKVLSLDKKDIDCIWSGLTITEERKENIEFSNAYLENRQVIIVLADSAIDTKNDLKDKVVSVQAGSSGKDAVSSESDVLDTFKELREFSNYTEALLDLSAGRTDAVVIDEIVGRYYMSKKAGEYKVATEDFGGEEYGIGFRKGEILLTEEVNKILQEMKEDGTSATISEKWFGEDIVK